MVCYDMLCYVKLTFVILWYVTLCHGMLCKVNLCYVMLRYGGTSGKESFCKEDSSEKKLSESFLGKEITF